MEKQYFVFKNEIRPDGVVNNSVVSRSSFASGLAEFFSQASKAPMNENFVSVHIILADSEMNVIKTEHIKGAYVEPEPEVEESAETEEAEA